MEQQVLNQILQSVADGAKSLQKYAAIEGFPLWEQVLLEVQAVTPRWAWLYMTPKEKEVHEYLVDDYVIEIDIPGVGILDAYVALDDKGNFHVGFTARLCKQNWDKGRKALRPQYPSRQDILTGKIGFHELSFDVALARAFNVSRGYKVGFGHDSDNV